MCVGFTHCGLCFYVDYDPNVASYDLDYVASMLLYGCFYGLDYVEFLLSERLPMLASMTHLWATIRGISFPVTSSLFVGVSLETFLLEATCVQFCFFAKPALRG
jgi:hypothetical protein